MSAYKFKKLGMDCCPDRNALRRLTSRAAGHLLPDADGSHVFHGNFDLEFKLLALPGIYDSDLPVFSNLLLRFKFLVQLMLPDLRRLPRGLFSLAGRSELTPLCSSQKCRYFF